MKTQLKIEWLKIKNYTAFKVIMIFIVIGIGGVNYLAYYFKKKVLDPGDPTHIISGGSLFDFPGVWQTVSYYSGCLLMLPALLVLILLTNEYTYRTSRQNIIDGMSRKEFIGSKMLIAFLLALFCTALVFLTALIFGFAGSEAFDTTGIENIGYFFLKALSYNFFATLIAVLVRRTGFAIAVFFIYTVLENGISLALFVWATNIKRAGGADLGNMGNYMPMNAADGLIYSPLSSLERMGSRLFPSDYTPLVLSLAAIYLLLFYFWATVKFRRSDL